MIGNSRFHRRSHAQRAMKLAEVVPAEVQCDGRPMVRELLTEAIRQPRQVPDLRPHREILPLHMRRADLRRVRISADHD